jgi:hypothetical protein
VCIKVFPKEKIFFRKVSSSGVWERDIKSSFVAYFRVFTVLEKERKKAIQTEEDRKEKT